MAHGKFEGTSKNNDLKEALNNAIATAMKDLKTDFVKWKLEEMFGENGGVVLAEILTVRIHAQTA